MKKPWWRQQSRSWVITLPGGRIRTLGKDEHGEGKENPPKHIIEKWHALEFQMRGAKPGEEHRPKDIRLRDLADNYVEYLTNPKTKVDTKAQLDWFIEYIGNVKVSQIEVHQVLAYLASKGTWSSTSKATALERITAAINWAIGVQRLDKAYRLEVPRMLRPKRKPRTTAITPTQEAKLEDAASDELRSILMALRHTGCRPGEMCGATIDQFHQRSKILFVLNKTRHQTEIEYRPVYLGPEMLALLKSQIGGREEGHIFLKANGTPWTPRYLSHVVWKLRNKLKLPKDVIPYNLRSMYATQGIENGVDIVTLSTLMGHQSIDMLKKHYARLGKSHLHEAAANMSRIADKVKEARNVADGEG